MVSVNWQHCFKQVKDREVLGRAARYWKKTDIAIYFFHAIYIAIFKEIQERITLFGKNYSRARVVHLHRKQHFFKPFFFCVDHHVT